MNSKLLTSLLACASLAIIAGCQKQEPNAAADIQKSSTTASETLKTAAPATITKQSAAQAARPQLSQQQIQALFDKAKALIAETKYQDALNTLGEIEGLGLTSDQQKLVKELRSQIQAALAKKLQ